MAAIRACASPTRAAMRGASWLPITQLGQPNAGQRRLIGGNRPPQRGCVPGVFDELEIERQMHLRTIRRAVPAGEAVVGQTDLADQDAVAIAIGQRAELGRDCMRFRLVGRIELDQPVALRAVGRPVRIDRIVG